MVKMLFFIQFRGQLRRTRPELTASLENFVAASACSAGGVVENGRKFLEASFDEDRIGFWLDMVIFLEKVYKTLKNAASELYGYALVLGRDISESSADITMRKLCRFSSGQNNRNNTGIWSFGEIQANLDYYAVFDRPVGNKGNSVPEGFSELRKFKSLNLNKGKNPYQKKIKEALAREKNENTLFLGDDLNSIRGAIYSCLTGPENLPPMTLRFGGGGLACFADVFTPKLQSFIAGAVSAESMKELNAAYYLLFRERLREEWPSSMMEKGRAFIRSLLVAYAAAAKSRASSGVLVLENTGMAGIAAEIFAEIFLSLETSQNNGKTLLVLGVDTLTGEIEKCWSGIFLKALKFNSGAADSAEIPPENMPQDLLELFYNVCLLERYFPPDLFPQLFEEEGLSREMFYRMARIFSTPNISVRENLHCGISSTRIEQVLGKRADKIRYAVRERILSWVLTGKLCPCFSLIEILSELGEKVQDALVLKSLRADVLDGTWKGIGKAIEEGRFVSLVGAGNAPLLEYIYRTLKALVWEVGAEITQVFQEPAPLAAMEDCYVGYQAQALTNLTAFHVGVRNIDAASEAARKAMLYNRGLKTDAVPAYRLFALVNISRQRIDDALEYISYALEQAEKNEQYDEVLFACYYASSINFLYGNLSKAERFAVRAEETAAELCQAKWRARARFLRGRLYFEIGHYSDALDIFESLDPGQGLIGGNEAEMTHTVQAWIFRTRNFLSRFALQEKTGDFDAGIFEMEAEYFAGNYKRAATLAEDFLLECKEETRDNFLFTEQPDWRSGFSQCEFMFQGEKVTGKRMAWVYRAMAQAALNPSQEAKAEILGGMQRFMRDELLPDTDPNDTLYFHAWYCMLRDTKAAQVDMNTVVSMAFKRLQRRAGRIDDRKTKQNFLNLPRWNHTLYLAAREYKLI